MSPIVSSERCASDAAPSRQKSGTRKTSCIEVGIVSEVWSAFRLKQSGGSAKSSKLLDKLLNPQRTKWPVSQASTSPPSLMPLETEHLLFPYQRSGVETLTANGRMLLADEVGLGKTSQALLAAYRLNYYPWLIICPAGLRLNWAVEIEKWLPSLFRSEDVQIVRAGTDPIRGRVCIVSYELAAARVDTLVAFNPGAVIADEVHILKDVEGQRVFSLIPFLRRCKRLLLLTGTPVLNRPIELYPLLGALRVPDLGTVHEFGLRYGNGRQIAVWFWGKGGKRVKKEVWDYTGASNLDELSGRLQPFMLRRLRKDVLDELPEKRRVKLTIETWPEIDEERLVRSRVREILRLFEGNVEAVMDFLRIDNGVDEGGSLMLAYQNLGLLKLPAGIEWAVNCFRSGAPLIVYAHHLAILEGYRTSLTDVGARVGVIVGSVPVDERQRLVNAFQAGELDVLLCGITAANSGITLTRASEMLVAELPWSPMIAEQIEGRIHRIGQTRGVTIRYLVAAGTLDETLWKIIEKKSANILRLVDGQMNEKGFGADETESLGGYWDLVREIVQEEAERRPAA
jgi:SWI/SNF-related matrix-associated actin-dependent regulator 1 of chromatin subfamily A